MGYQGFMMPLNHQAGMQGTLKQHLPGKRLVDRALKHHISFLLNGIYFDARSIHMLCFTSQ